MYVSPHGKSEGLADRLKKWASALGQDRTYPWTGLGLIADLEAAAAQIEGQPAPQTATLEFDL